MTGVLSGHCTPVTSWKRWLWRGNGEKVGSAELCVPGTRLTAAQALVHSVCTAACGVRIFIPILETEKVRLLKVE